MIFRLPAALAAVLVIAAMRPVAADYPPLTSRPSIRVPGGAGSFDFMAFDAPMHRLLAAHTAAKTLVVLDLKTGDVRSVPVGKAQGVAVDPADNKIFVGCSEEQQVAVVDRTTLQKIAEVKTGGPVDAVAFNARDGMLYAGHDDGGQVWVIDGKTNELKGTVSIPGAPEDVVCDPTANRVYQNIKTNDTVQVIDPAHRAVLSSWSTAPAASPHGLALDSLTKRLFAAGKNGKLAVIDAGTGQAVAAVEIGPGVDQIAFDPANQRVYCACQGVISVVQETATGARLLGNVPSPKGAHTLTVDPETHSVWICYADDKDSYLQEFGSATGLLKGPYLQNPTVDAITLCWESSTAARGTVRYGVHSLDERRQQDEKAVRIHRVRLTGLKPYTHYRYTVECLGESSEGAFRTAAPANQPFKFAVYGDTRTQPDMHAAVLKRMAQFQPDFILQTGDLVADGTKEALWTEFFRVTGETLRRTPYYPCLGNHERGGELYLHYFEVPREYSFDYGNIHIISLDSNRPAAEYAAQEEWLRNDLRAHQDATWRLVFFHHTPYTCVAMPARRVLAEKLRARLEPILLAGHVQVVFNGHDHDYQHHLANGIHYVVTGGGGAPLYDVQADTPYVRCAKKAHHYCEVTVAGDRLTIVARATDGTVLEEFTVP
jgi:DNA-binding beta-propeller fold protein YncE